MAFAIEHVLALSMALFAVGAVGALLRRHLVVVLLSIQLMLAASGLALVGFNRAWAATPEGVASMSGQIFALLALPVAAAQLAVGLGLVVALVRQRRSLDVEDAGLLRW